MTAYKRLLKEVDGLLSEIFMLKTTKALIGQLKNLLLENWTDVQKETINDAIRRLSAEKGDITKPEAKKIMDKISESLGVVYSEAVRSGIKKIASKAYLGKQEQIIGYKPSFNMVDIASIDWLEKDAVYWSRNHYGSHIQDKIQSAVKTIISQGYSRQKAGTALQSAFYDTLNESQMYWEGLSNHIVTRSQQFGAIEGYVKAEITHYRIIAQIDDRTSPICIALNGRIIPVKRGEDLRDKLIAAKTPEKVKKIAPWVGASKVKGKKTASLPVGLSLPPYHWLCRTDTVAVFDDDLNANKYEMGEKLNSGQIKLLESYTSSEYGNIISDIQKKKHYKWNEKDWRDDVKKVEVLKHIGEFKGDVTPKEFRERPGKIIKSARYITANAYKDNIQMVFYSPKERGYVVTDLNGMIRGLYGHSKPDAVKKAFEGKRRKELWVRLNENL